MQMMTLEAARTIIDKTLAYAREKGLKPLGVSVLDMRGKLKAYVAEDGTSLFRSEISFGKAHAALGMGFGTGEMERRATHKPHFAQALAVATGGTMIPARGGVLILDGDNEIIGAVGISGDVSENDEAAAIAGIEGAGFTADAG